MPCSLTSSSFNPRAPCGARPVLDPVLHVSVVVSIHAPRAGRDTLRRYARNAAHAFQSTRPVRGATSLQARTGCTPIVSIHAPRAGRDNTWARAWAGVTCFNPRAPCGARRSRLSSCPPNSRVSIHAPRAGRDRKLAMRPGSCEMFQSTRPVRGATKSANRSKVPIIRFNPRAPCGARP